MTKEFCFTVDVDRDVNECVPGRRDAVSLRCSGARYTSSEAGTNILLDILDEIGIKATFFAEARTLENINFEAGNNEVAMHGLDHEDMTGKVSGVHITDGELHEIMNTSMSIIKERTGKVPKGFRAPYMRTDARIMNTLKKNGIVYDSSVYADVSKTMYPYDTGNGVIEIPIPVARDGNGKKIFGYLWPMHEGLRKPEDYIKMANCVEDGVFVIATHSWHMTESREGIMDAERIRKNADSVKEIITSVLDSGFRAVRMTDVADAYAGM